MKPGSKYYPLHQRLAQHYPEPVTLTLGEIEEILASPLPISARKDRTWWSNRNRGALQASAWMSAGYHTHQIDLEVGRVTFKQIEAPYRVEDHIRYVDGQIAWDQAAIKALRQHMKLTQAKFAETLGVRRQTISEWENGVYEPDRSTTKHLALVAEKEAFDPKPNLEQETEPADES